MLGTMQQGQGDCIHLRNLRQPNKHSINEKPELENVKNTSAIAKKMYQQNSTKSGPLKCIEVNRTIQSETEVWI